MRQYLTAATGVKLPATLLFDYPAPAVLAEYMWREAFGQDTGHLPVLEELDRVAALLASLAHDAEGRSQIAARLEAITRGFHASPAAGPGIDPEFETATNDEMFALVEKELEASENDG
jgi:hypothetical protein